MAPGGRVALVASWCCWLAVASCERPRGEPATVGPIDRCESDEECATGACLVVGAGRRCAPACDGACPNGLVCKRLRGRDPASPTACLPPAVALCEPCAQDADCGGFGDLCLPRDQGLYCAQDCSVGGGCPEGFRCEVVLDDRGNESGWQCAPSSGTCTCSDLNLGAKRACLRTTPQVGTCIGTETCVPPGGWIGCDARTPALEICDGIDNDCSGEPDDAPSGQTLERSCGYGPEPRRRECVGVDVCTDGVFGGCSLPPPLVRELACDGFDDDCNGAVDDGLLGTPDHCRACGDECPPGPGGDDETLRTCAEAPEGRYCAPVRCRNPFYDVNGLEEDGCERADNHRRIGDTVIVNDTPESAFGLASGGLACGGGASLVVCDASLPADGRVHVPDEQPPRPIDYWAFDRDDSASSCGSTLRIGALVLPSGADSLPSTVELCLSEPVAAGMSAVFSPARCVSGVVSGPTLLELAPADASEADYLIRVTLVDGRLAGSYKLAAVDGVAMPLTNEPLVCP